MASKSIRVEVLGYVKNEIEGGRVEDWKEITSEIVLDERYGPLLDGIEDFSHIVVVFWMHQVKGYEPKIHPRGRTDIPRQGVFATRTPLRPNPIGISVVSLIDRRGSSLIVSGLDCLNGTPVLDIKPYTPKSMEIAEIRVPEWMKKLLADKENP